MHPRNLFHYFALILFFALVWIYYTVDFGAAETDKIFITITTFFFSIFTGFFITRQGNRYTKLREIISTYDGKMSGIYRVAGNLPGELQPKIAQVIKNHYQKLIEAKSWDYHFTHKSTTITDLHKILEENIGDNKLESLRNQAIGRTLTNLGDCQILRKNMIMLFGERIPLYQWLLIILFVLILLLAISVIPSAGFILGATLKAGFVVAIVMVAIILYNLDNLHLFENFIGEGSALDVISTIDGTK